MPDETSGGGLRRVLLVDRSGRGHAFADLLVRSRRDLEVIYAPGSPLVHHDRITPWPDLSLTDPAPMVDRALETGVDWVMVTHAGALSEGFVDAFRGRGLPVVGPDREAFRLEAEKSHAKAFCRRHGVPTARWASFDDPEEARAWIADAPFPVVVKAEGLCGGAGVVVPDTPEEAAAAVDRMLTRRELGEAGRRVVIEERLEGEEISLFALVDARGGARVLPMALDYPRLEDGNRGLLCGGTGAVSPHPREAEVSELLQQALLLPVLQGIAAEGLAYTGVIYLGAMLTEDGPKLLEINGRMGDPEAEVVLPRIEEDFVAVVEAVLEGRLAGRGPGGTAAGNGKAAGDGDSLLGPPFALDPRTFVDVVAYQGPVELPDGRRAPGWPSFDLARGQAISGLERVDRRLCQLFIGEAGTDLEGRPVSDGGRVLHFVGAGEDAETAAAAAYAGIAPVAFPGMGHRRDIGRVHPGHGGPLSRKGPSGKD